MSKIICSTTGETANSYPAYLKTEHWKNRREEFLLSITDAKCMVCWDTKNINVHHRTYARIGKEFDNDLIVLCNECHNVVHKIAERLKANGFETKWHQNSMYQTANRIKHKAREYAVKDRKNEDGRDIILRKPNGHEKRKLA